MLERQILPRNKSCSGCLINRTIDLIQAYFGLTVPTSVMCTPFENRGMIFVSDNGKEYKFPQQGLNIWRSEFDYWLAKVATEYGAILREDAPVISLEQNKQFVIVKIGGNNPHTEIAKYVIDCEGAIGVLKKSVINSKQSFIMTYQTFNDGYINLDNHYFYAFLQTDFSQYDAWLNVKNNMMVLGVAAVCPEKLPELYQKFISYMKNHYGLVITCQKKEEKWLLPQIRPDFQIHYAKDRIFFAGEVAGFLNPMGEGISCGMESAYCLANAIHNHFNSAQQIEIAYKELSIPLKERMVRQWQFVGSIADTFAEMKNSRI